MTEPTPEELAAAQALSDSQNWGRESLINAINGATHNHLSYYPEGEVETWPAQQADAELFTANGVSAVTGDAPFLRGVVIEELKITDGEAFVMPDEATLLPLVAAKVAIVKANADAWSAAMICLNAVRSVADAAIIAATDPEEVSQIVGDAVAQIAAAMATE